jgi:hypothetical protein
METESLLPGSSHHDFVLTQIILFRVKLDISEEKHDGYNNLIVIF